MMINIERLNEIIAVVHLFYWRMALTCSNLPWMSSFTLGEFARTRTYSPDHANRSCDHDHANRSSITGILLLQLSLNFAV